MSTFIKDPGEYVKHDGQQVNPSVGVTFFLDNAAKLAVRYDKESDKVAFDWPLIEQVAQTNEPGSAYAKMFLAARQFGTNETMTKLREMCEKQ